MSMKKLTDRIGAQLSAAQKEAQERHAREERLALLWDAHCEANPQAARCLQPWILHTTKLYGSNGTYAFRDATPEQCVELLEAFPPVPMVIHRDARTSCIGVRPMSAADSDALSVEPVPGGAVMRIDCLAQFGETVRVDWFCSLQGNLVELNVTLAKLYGVTPRMHARIEYSDRHHTRISRVSECRPEYVVAPIEPLTFIRYSASSREAFSTLLVHGHVAEYMSQLAEVCFERREHSRRAYELDRDAGLKPVAEAPSYDMSGSLRAGTREQYDALNTLEARTDRALAEKHWKCYAEQYGIETRQSYFDYFAWACAYLKLQRLYEVPDPRDPSRTYKFGTAWL